MLLEDDPLFADLLLAKTDAGIEVHQRLGPYIRASGLTARMKLSTRTVNMIYIIRDYSPMTTVLAMALLPLVLIPIYKGDDLFKSIAVKHATYLVLSRRLFLATYLARSIHSYATYRHLDPSLMANFYSMELWSGPCKSIFCFLPNTQCRFRRTAKPAKLCPPPSLPSS